MRIGFPVLKKANVGELEFDNTLHGCKYFGFFDEGEKYLRIKETNELNAENSGNGLVDYLKQKGISTIVCPELHPMAAKFFMDNNIGIFQANNSNVMSNIKDYFNNKLAAFSSETTIQKASCSSDCGSCSSTCSEFEQEVVAI